MAVISGALITTSFSFVTKSCDNRRHAFQLLFSRSLAIKNPFSLQENCKFRGDDGVDGGLRTRFRVSCKVQAEETQLRRCSPFLESALLSEDNVLSSEWKAIPDIWRSSAQKYGDWVALVDPYHDPPTEMTYKQLEEEILDFSEGLRVIGLNPYEKLALFAENSCRWLVADQGECKLENRRTLCVVCHARVTKEQCAERRSARLKAKKQLKELMNDLRNVQNLKQNYSEEKESKQMII